MCTLKIIYIYYINILKSTEHELFFYFFVHQVYLNPKSKNKYEDSFCWQSNIKIQNIIQNFNI